jgi:hypothetical protein
MFYLRNPNSGQKDVSLTAFIFGFMIATFKLLVAGMTIYSFKMSTFSGGDYALVVGALGSLHIYNSLSNNNSNSDQGGQSAS